MKNFKVNGDLGEFELSLPESLEEIPVDYFKECTEFVHPAPNYALVAIVYKDSLNLILTASKKKEGVNVAIIPVFVKAGVTDSEFVNSLNIGDKVVVAASDLSIGNHINSPYNKITPDNIVRVCQGAGREFYQSTLELNSPICLVEFKLIPVGAIRSKLDRTKNSFVNPFIHKAIAKGGEA
jgi:hypothetical protein